MRILIFSLLWTTGWLFSEELTVSAPLQETFANAGENAGQIRGAWEKCPTEQRKGMEFLLINMPTRDAQTLTTTFLLENVALAYQARREMPWGKDIPEEIFFNDVLPYACLDETRDAWRADFFKRFRAVIGDATTAHAALQRVNASIAKETRVQYSTKRRAANQGPQESMELKMASCTGLSILLADALRSICIPARITGTAMWANNKGNHNWIEVWLPENKSWKFTEYGDKSVQLDQGWLLAEAAKATPSSVTYGVYSSSWKKSATHFPLVWNPDSTSVAAVEVSQRYIALGTPQLQKADECELQIDVVKKSADGSTVREPVEIEVLQDDNSVAKGTTPAATDDANRFLCIRVSQGASYRVTIPGKTPAASQQVTTKKNEKNVRITLQLP